MDPIFEAYTEVINEAKVDYSDAFEYDVTEDDFSTADLAQLALDSIKGLEKWIKDNRENLEDFSGSKFSAPLKKFFKDFDAFTKKNKLKIKKFDYEPDFWDQLGEILGL